MTTATSESLTRRGYSRDTRKRRGLKTASWTGLPRFAADTRRMTAGAA